jgi:hypothetical protein
LTTPSICRRLQASTEFVAKLKLQNLELVAMCERQQEDHDASAQAAAKAATGPTASSVNVEELKFELEVAQAEIMTVRHPLCRDAATGMAAAATKGELPMV